MQIQLSWTDPATGEQRGPRLETPIALGRVFAEMPQEIDGKRVSRIVLGDDRVSNYHALIDVSNDELIVVDQNTATGTLINGVRLPTGTLLESDRLQVGPYEIQINLSEVRSASSEGGCDRKVGFLFPRRCGRTDRTGCPYCDTNNSNNDPYLYEHSYYSGFGRYERGYWGSNYYDNRDYYFYNSETGNVDFTEADNISMEMEGDEDFEVDMGAS